MVQLQPPMRSIIKKLTGNKWIRDALKVSTYILKLCGILLLVTFMLIFTPFIPFIAITTLILIKLLSIIPPEEENVTDYYTGEKRKLNRIAYILIYVLNELSIRILDNAWQRIRRNAFLTGWSLMLFGVLTMIIPVIKDNANFLSINIGFISIGLAFLAIHMSVESDKRMSAIANMKIDEQIAAISRIVFDLSGIDPLENVPDTVICTNEIYWNMQATLELKEYYSIEQLEKLIIELEAVRRYTREYSHYVTSDTRNKIREVIEEINNIQKEKAKRD